MSKTKKEMRFRNYAVQRSYYYDSHDKDGKSNGMTEAKWKRKIKTEWTPDRLKANSVCMIFHDKDVDENGNPTGLHAHAVINFEQGLTQSNAMSRTGCTTKENCKGVDKLVGAYRYLIHVSESALNEMKYIYPINKVITLTADGVSFDYRKALTRAKEKKDKASVEDAVSGMLHKVGTGEMTVDEVRDVYKNDADGTGFTLSQWYKDKRMYEEAEKEYLSAMHGWYKVHNRCLTGIYIEGEGESGKSDLGKLIAMHNSDKRGYHVAAAPGKSTTYDPVGKYRGEKVSIFNEMEGCNFSVKQFTDMFDPIHASDVNSRNVDKPWFASMFIFTNSVPLEDFIDEMIGRSGRYGDDKVHQVRRRFVLNIVFGKYTQEYYTDDDECYTEQVKYFKVYVRDAQIKCPVAHPNEKYWRPFRLFSTVYPDIVGEEAVLNVIDMAVKDYYDKSGYSITPWTVEQPVIE